MIPPNVFQFIFDLFLEEELPLPWDIPNVNGR